MSVDFRQNADDNIGMNPSRDIGSSRPQVSNCNIFDSVIRVFPWHVTIKSEGENLVENLRDNKIFKNVERKNNFEFEKLGAKIL